MSYIKAHKMRGYRGTSGLYCCQLFHHRNNSTQTWIFLLQWRQRGYRTWLILWAVACFVSYNVNSRIKDIHSDLTKTVNVLTWEKFSWFPLESIFARWNYKMSQWTSRVKFMHKRHNKKHGLGSHAVHVQKTIKVPNWQWSRNQTETIQ